jgi:hypothetical protein
VGARARRGDLLQRWLAAGFAAVLAIAPLARPYLPIELTAVPVASLEGLVAQDNAHGKQPATRVRPAQPSNLGIFPRLALIEMTLGPPPAKPSLLQSAVDQPVLARPATAPGGELQWVFEPSSVGSARAPTGPPLLKTSL